MNSRPKAADLLDVARDAFVAEVLPTLTAGTRYTGLMIANALAIARRELEAGDAPLRAALERLQSLYPDIPRNVPPDELRATVALYSRRLVQDIRSGRYDAGPALLREHLRRTTRAKLAMSNPKLLKES